MRIVEPSSGWPGAVQADAVVAAELAEDGDNFLGSFVSADGKVTLVAGTDEGHRVASQNARLGTGVVVEQAGLTSEEAQRLGDQVRSLSPNLRKTIFMWGADPQSRGIFVTTLADVTEDDSVLINGFAAEHRVHIRVEVEAGAGLPTLDDTRQGDPSPFAGGARYGNANGGGPKAKIKQRCSTGFGYHKGSKKFMLTAGHCHPRNVKLDWGWIYTGTPDSPIKWDLIGRARKTTWKNGVGTVDAGADSARHGDLALIRVRKRAGAGK